MPVLDNPRMERFAQEVAKGTPPIRAYPKAGYEQHNGNPYRLRENERVASRIQELIDRGAAQAEFTRAKAIEVALEGALDARAAGQHGPQIAGIRLACDVAGHIVTKSLNINADLDDIPLSRLAELDRLLVGGPAAPMIDVSPST